MHSRRKRTMLLSASGGGLAAIILYRLTAPTEFSAQIIAALLLVTGIIAVLVEAGRVLDERQFAFTQQKTYAITWESAVLTTMVTGVMMLIVLYGTAFIIGALTYISGARTASSELLIDMIYRVQVMNNLPNLEIAAMFIIGSLALATGFWAFYPLLPTRNEEIAAPWAFMFSAIYVAGTFYLLFPQTIYIDHLIHFAYDAALIAFWGKLFADTYEYVEKYLL